MKPSIMRRCTFEHMTCRTAFDVPNHSAAVAGGAEKLASVEEAYAANITRVSLEGEVWLGWR